MPTFKTLILKHQKKDDGTYGVKIRITHKRETRYIPTEFYVNSKQLTRELEVKDLDILRKLEDKINVYWTIIKKTPDVETLTVDQLLSLFEREKRYTAIVDIDFIAFSRTHIDNLALSGKKKYADSFKTTVNSLIDFFGRETIPITEINASNLTSYVKYLRTERDVVRLNQFKKEVKIKQAPMGNGVQTYITNIRTLFNEARFQFNDEDEGIIRIKHYPFQKFKLERKTLTDKRSLKPTTINKIKTYIEKKTTRASLGRDVFMLSFYLVGTNIIDLYEARLLEDDRISYNRSKTADRREDRAQISIKIEPEAKSLINKYRDEDNQRVFDFYKRYTNSENFITAVNKGLKKISKDLELGDEVSTYYARHSWATIARNICGVPKEDISMALNHSDPTHKVTDIYLATDWTIIDKANRKVLNTLLPPKLIINGEDYSDMIDYLIEEMKGE